MTKRQRRNNCGAQRGRTMLYYSGGCRFCRWTARQLHDMDPHLGICPFREPEAELHLGDIPIEHRVKHWWVVTPDGKRFEGNHGGGVALLSNLRWLWPLGRALRFFHLSKLVDWLDDIINMSRPILAGWVSDGPAPKRHV
jgi:hypothetical protein